MGQFKTWQIVTLVVAGAAVAAAAWYTLGRGEERIELVSSITMVDVTTGDLFEFSVTGRRGVMVPAEHPDSGKVVLLPVHKDEQGRWVVGDRERQILGSLEEQARAVDSVTGVVTVSSDRVRRVR